MCYWPVKIIIQISKHAPQQRGHPHPRHITEFPSFRTIENVLPLSKRGNFNQMIYTHKTDTIQTQAACLPWIYLLGECYWFMATMMTTDCWRNNGADRMRLAFRITHFAGHTLPFCDHIFRAGNNERRFPPKLFQWIYRFAFIRSLPQALITSIKILFLFWHTHTIPKGYGDVGRQRSGPKYSFLNLHTHERAFSTPPLTWTEISLNKTANPSLW